jgi:tetratricopeptide (TPR) repeat protein
MNIFKRKEIFKVESEEVKPEELAEPNNAEEFFNRGMAFYARKQFEEAEKDMLKAISIDQDFYDAHYSLGMIRKAQDRKDEATQAFQHTLFLLEQMEDQKNPRIDMLKKLAKGHINEINIGDWDLEKEVWKREE